MGLIDTFFKVMACGSGASLVMAWWDDECWRVWMAVNLGFLAGMWFIVLFVPHP